ncbi:MAG: FAD-dependent oxidoreductase [Pseudomonadota bacterium]|nr:FAD-dependent oxidoreductase [Pseudomonadota bacterium]
MNRRHFFQTSVAAAVAYSLPYGRLYALDQAASQAAGGIPAVTLDGKPIVIEQAAIKDLQARMRGPVLLSGDAAYEQARRVLNESINKHPALVVQPTGVADVQSAINFARERELLVAVKCGGHSPGGKSTCDRGMQIDLSRFRGVRVDAAAKRAYVDGGSLLGELDHEAMALGLVTTSGTVSHTGVGGLTLGGGFGRLARRFGLALDNVRAVDIVTADGRYLHADPDDNPDLYWGVRGGGGNFGVVTNFEFELHPMQREVVAGSLVFPLARARELLAFYGEYSAEAPDELYVDAIISAPRDGKPGVFVLAPVWSGAAGDAERVLAPIRKLGNPIADTIKAWDYVALQRSTDRSDPRNEGTYLKSGFIDAYPGDLPGAIVDGFQADPKRNTVLFFQQSGGAIARQPVDSTAFPHRRSTHNMLSIVSWSLADDGKPHMDYLRKYWAGLERFTNGYYTNETADEAQSVVDDNYQGNLPRMREVKKKYDPGNLFRLNANVQPG